MELAGSVEHRSETRTVHRLLIKNFVSRFSFRDTVISNKTTSKLILEKDDVT
jgi:hypothetical protein